MCMGKCAQTCCGFQPVDVSAMFVVVICQKAVPYRTMRYNWWITAPDLFSHVLFLLFLLLINISLITLITYLDLFSIFISIKNTHYYFASDELPILETQSNSSREKQNFVGGGSTLWVSFIIKCIC